MHAIPGLKGQTSMQLHSHTQRVKSGTVCIDYAIMRQKDHAIVIDASTFRLL